MIQTTIITFEYVQLIFFNSKNFLNVLKSNFLCRRFLIGSVIEVK